jgi:hypothetical protein
VRIAGARGCLSLGRHDLSPGVLPRLFTCQAHIFSIPSRHRLPRPWHFYRVSLFYNAFFHVSHSHYARRLPDGRCSSDAPVFLTSLISLTPSNFVFLSTRSHSGSSCYTTVPLSLYGSRDRRVSRKCYICNNPPWWKKIPPHDCSCSELLVQKWWRRMSLMQHV